MPALTDRVDRLEEALTKFIDQTSVIVAEIRARSPRTDRQSLEMQQKVEERSAQVERQLLEMQQRADKERQEAEKDRRDLSRHLAEISERRGTLIEKKVEPCGFQLARAIFGTEEARTCGMRVRGKHPSGSGEIMELDLLAIGPTKVLAVEAKRRMDAEKAVEYRRKLARLSEFWPALAGKTVCPAVASVYLEPALITFLNREKIYGIAMGDEVMEVVNLGGF